MARKKRPKSKNPPYRPPHAPTEESRAVVQALSALGTHQDEICRYLSKMLHLPLASENSLRKHYASELVLGKTHQKLKVSQSLYAKAVGAPAEYDENHNLTKAETKPEVTAQIFWLKAQAGWTEPSRFGTSSSGGNSDGMSLEELIHLSYQAGVKKALPPPTGAPAT